MSDTMEPPMPPTEDDVSDVFARASAGAESEADRKHREAMESIHAALPRAREVTAMQERLKEQIAAAEVRLDRAAVLEQIRSGFAIIIFALEAGGIHPSALRAVEQMEKRTRSFVDRFVMDL